jgi:hypothetical protein
LKTSSPCYTIGARSLSKMDSKMIINRKLVSKKDQIITSMAKKLADVSTVDDLERTKKKELRRPIEST